MSFAESLAQSLEPAAEIFRSLNVPEPIVHWGHPAMMGIVAFVMGSGVAIAGWKGRLSEDAEVSSKNREMHRKTAPLMAAFLIMGYTGGVLSLVMQHKPLLESPHFVTGSIVVFLLLLNGSISFFGFKGEAIGARKAHAYIGSALGLLLVAHAALGIKLGLSI
jgi:Protein of unknown function (DUF4079)